MVSILGFFMLMLVAGSLVFFFSGSDDKATESDDLAEMTGEGGQAALEKALDIVFEDIVVLAPFERISLKSSSAMGMISLDIALELTDHRSRKMVVAVEDRLRKIIQGQVREMTWLELRNPEGKIRLKYELLKRMNSVFPKVTIRNIYFTNFLMQ
jgi:flagellar FliL protein